MVVELLDVDMLTVELLDVDILTVEVLGVDMLTVELLDVDMLDVDTVEAIAVEVLALEAVVIEVLGVDTLTAKVLAFEALIIDKDENKSLLLLVSLVAVIVGGVVQRSVATGLLSGVCSDIWVLSFLVSLSKGVDKCNIFKFVVFICVLFSADFVSSSCVLVPMSITSIENGFVELCVADSSVEVGDSFTGMEVTSSVAEMLLVNSTITFVEIVFKLPLVASVEVYAEVRLSGLDVKSKSPDSSVFSPLLSVDAESSFRVVAGAVIVVKKKALIGSSEIA